jgi:tetratricopeptide (TPR) repeat protein
MPSPPQKIQPPPRYYLRRPGGSPSGPYVRAALIAMLGDGKLNGSEEISEDRQKWRSVRTLETQKGPPPPPVSSPPRDVAVDLGYDDGISLAPLEVGFGASVAGADPHATPSKTARAVEKDGAREADPETEQVDIALELVERKAVPRGKPIEQRPGAEPTGAAPPPQAVGNQASTAVDALLDANADTMLEATRPVRLDDARPVAEPRIRPRTLTAARPGGLPARRGPSKRVVLIAASVLVLAVAGVVAVVLDVPDRLRGEPAIIAVLGPLAAEIAQDSFPAFSEGARRLEEAAGSRKHATATRAAAAELLAASVVLHGAERGRITHAEMLLGTNAAATAPAIAARARAEAWVALAKGRWKEVERIISETPLSEGDRGVLSGWAALGRQDAAHAALLFAKAQQALPAPAPSRLAALYALALAREADLSPAAEAAYRAVLAEAPGHVGAALGLARVSKLSPTVRLRLVEAVIAKQPRQGSGAELADAYALVCRAAGELGDADRAEVALKRAREADPASVGAAVAAGDALLAAGRTDEAVTRYKLSLAAPISAPRTSFFHFARIAALVESGRADQGVAALTELDRRLPGDARVSFWRGRIAERAHPADTAGAERAYRDTLARDPRFLPGRLQLARLLLDQHRGTDALAILKRAETEGATPGVLRVALGQALLESGNAAEAARAFRKVLGSDPTNSSAHLGLASALEAQGDLEGARSELASLAAHGDVPGLGARVAVILIKLGRKEEALAAYQKEIAAGGIAVATTKVAAARLAIELGHKDAARALAESAVEDDPRTPGALLVLAGVWRLLGDSARALLALRRALAVDGSAEVQLEYGRALSALGRDEEALSALEQARDIPEAGVERGRILLRRGEIDSAIKELSAATSRLPSHAEAYLLLGQAEDRLGHVVRAEAAWKTAVKLNPTSAESRYRLGRLQMDQGQTASALPHLRTAAEHVPPAPADVGWRPDLYFQLGFAELRHGARDRALAAFRKYLEVAPADAPARVEVTRQIHEIVP